MTPRAKASPRRTASPRGVAPSVTFKWDALADVQSDVEKLLRAHWREVDVFHDDAPLDPDWKRYAQLEEFGWLGIVAARAGGQLVGYMTIIIGPHLHHKTVKWATVDVMYLAPEYRHGWTGVRFIKAAERGLRKLGIRVFWFAVKEHFRNWRGRDVGEVLKFLGFDCVEVTYAKVLK